MPTVRHLRPTRCRFHLQAPGRWGKSSELAALEHALLEVELSDGSIGRAEVAIRPTIYGETLGSVRAGLEYLRPRLLGLEADDQEGIRAVLEAFPFNFGLKGALDTALWEAWARSEGEELYQVLKPAKHRVRVAYILGLAVPFFVVALFADRIKGWLRRAGRISHYVEVLAGVVLVLVGVLLFTGTFTALNTFFLRITPEWLQRYL